MAETDGALSADASLNQAKALIEARRVRATSARLKVLAVLLEAGRPLTHAEVQPLLEPQMDRVTLYRVLDWLEAIGITHRINAADRTTRFSVSHAPHCHAHFQCQRCGRIYCLNFQATFSTADLPSGFVAEAVDVNVTGVCAACA